MCKRNSLQPGKLRLKEQMIKNQRLQKRLLLAVMISALSPRFAAAQSATASIVKTGSQPTSKDIAASLVPTSKLPPCPEAGIPAPHPSSVTGHHKVALTWKASAPSMQAISNPVGYCLYRSKKKGLPKMALANPNVRCGGCEQVNQVPVVGVGCIDDLVEDNTTYYYVVTAISAAGSISSASAEAVSIIPLHKSSSTAFPSAYPSCRVPGYSK